MRHSKIIASGSYAPERVIANEWFNEQLGEDVDTWLRENLTICQRRWMSDDQSTSDLCTEAGNAALAMASLHPEDIDLLIIATDGRKNCWNRRQRLNVCRKLKLNEPRELRLCRLSPI